jgi:D-3-phosphoglycerate dehydrogenase
VRRPTRDLHAATVGIVGFGGNGRRLAELLQPFRVKIVATDMFPVDKPDYVDSLWPANDLERVLKVADVLILCVPLNDQTRSMINRRTLARMKPGSVLLNVARGPVVVEQDLVEALESGHLGGAGLDVTEVEPLSPDSPLWEMPNVIITPHVAAQSANRVNDTTDFFCDNLNRFLAGRPLRNLVDKRLGFPRRESQANSSNASTFSK